MRKMNTRKTSFGLSRSLADWGALPFLFLFLAVWPARSENKTIVIYHTSDVHGHYFSEPWERNDENKGRLRGGYAALASAVKKETAPCVLVDSGDIFQGTAEGNLTHGEASIRFMNALGYRAMAAGNHDYDQQEPTLRRLASMASFPILGGNVYVTADESRPDYLKDWTVVEVGGIRLGILGLAGRTTYRTTLPSNVQHLHFKDEGPEAARILAELQKQNVDAAIAIVHTGLSDAFAGKVADPNGWVPDQKTLDSRGSLDVARQAKTLAAVFGGHYHAGLRTAYVDPETKTLILESGSNLLSASRLELTFDEQKHLIHADGGLVQLWVDQLGEDPEILKLGESVRQQMGPELDRVVGKTLQKMTRDDQALESELGSWITDVIRATVPVDVAIYNQHGIRADLPEGEVRLRDLYEVIPFDNSVVTMQLTGAQLAQLMQGNLGEKRSNMLVSGMSFTYRWDGQKAVDLTLEIGGKPVTPEAVYRVATNNFVAAGGSGGTIFLQGADIQDTGISVRDMLIQDLEHNSPIPPPTKGRGQKLP